MQPLLGQVLCDVDLEAHAFQRVAKCTRVVNRLFRGSFGVGIIGVADNQGEPRACLLGRGVADR